MPRQVLSGNSNRKRRVGCVTPAGRSVALLARRNCSSAWLTVLLAAALATGDRAFAFEAGEQVVVREATELRLGEKVVAELEAGRVLEVRAVQGSWLAVAEPAAGWIAEDEVLAFDRALQYFTRQLEADPKNVRAYLARANLWEAHARRRFDQAEGDFSRAIEHAEKSQGATFFKRGVIRARREQIDQAIEDFTQALDRNPQNLGALERRGQLWMKKGRHSQAIGDFSQIVKLSPWRKEVYLVRGNAYFEAGMIEEAYEDFSQVLRLDPYNADAYYQRGRTNLILDRKSVAINDLSQAIELAPDLADAYYQRALVWLARENEEKALDDLTACLRIEPRHQDALIQRADLCYELGQYDNAITDYSRSIELNPGYTEAYINRGKILLARGDAQGAVADFDRATLVNLEQAPDSYREQYANAYFLRGMNHLGNVEFDEALEDFARTLRLEPDRVEALLNRGSLYLRRKEYNKALADFSTVVTLKPEEAAPYDTRAHAYYIKGDYQAAVQDYLTALQNDPQYVPAYVNFAWLLSTCPDEQYRNGKQAIGHATVACKFTEYKEYKILDTLAAAHAEAGNWQEAVRWQARVVAMAPPQERPTFFARYNRYREQQPYRDEERDSTSRSDPLHPDNLYLKANGYFHAGEFEKAIEEFDKVIRLAPDRSEAYYKRGKSAEELGRLDSAVADYEQTVRLDPNHAPAYTGLALVYFDQGEYAQARQYYTEATRVDPTYVPAYANMAWLLATCPEAKFRNGNKAVHYAVFACKLTGWSEFRVLDTLAAAYAQAGRFEEAVHWQEKVVDMAPLAEQAEFRDRLALYKQEKPVAAKDSTNDLLAQLDASKGAADAPDPQPRDELPDEPDEPDAVKALEKLGAKFNRDDQGGVRAVELQYTKLKDEDLVHLKGLPRLEVVNLTFTRVTDDGLEHLKELKTLKLVNLDETRITDEGLKHLAALPRLEVLSLNATQITSAGLEHLESLPRLNHLLLANTRVSSDKIEAFKEGRPELKLHR